MTEIFSIVRRTLGIALVAAGVGLSGCQVYPAGSCMSCQGCGCDQGHQGAGGHCASCGHGHKTAGRAAQADAAQEHVPIPLSRFHPVPTRPVFAPRGPVGGPAAPIEYDYQVPEEGATASVMRRRSAPPREPQPTLARRPAAEKSPEEPPLEVELQAAITGLAAPASVRRSPTASANRPVTTAEPKRLSAELAEDSVQQSTTPVAAVPAEVVAEEAVETPEVAEAEVWRARLMSR